MNKLNELDLNLSSIFQPMNFVIKLMASQIEELLCYLYMGLVTQGVE